jgi:hypothetical protein
MFTHGFALQECPARKLGVFSLAYTSPQSNAGERNTKTQHLRTSSSCRVVGVIGKVDTDATR